MPREKVCIVGSGNWGSVIAKIAASNVEKYPADFHPTVHTWVFEELIGGRKLTDIINESHENVKYLPGVKLPENLKAVPDLTEATTNATVLVFCLPHQFVKGVCDELKGKIKPSVQAISLIKGVDTGDDGLKLMSNYIIQRLGDINMSVLSGANIADEVAREKFCETTIGTNDPDGAGQLFLKLFSAPYFSVQIVQDPIAVELCGALKNIIAVASGFVDALKMGENTKAAIIRLGLMEIRKFVGLFNPGVKDMVFFMSCGVADLITSCYGGRNRSVAEAFALTGKSLAELEREMLNGQKLQGPSTAKQVHKYLQSKNLTHEFPLFTRVYQICYEKHPVKTITEY